MMMAATRQSSTVCVDLPTLEEAKEATSDLMEVIGTLKISEGLTTWKHKALAESGEMWASSLIAKDSVKVSQVSELDESAPFFPLVSKPGIQALLLLQRSPEAQKAVASLASDKNIWDAALKNKEVREFYNKHRPTLPRETYIAPNKSTAGNESPKESSEYVESPNKDTSKRSAFAGWFKKIKSIFLEMVRNIIYRFFGEFFGVSNLNWGPTNTTTSCGPTDSKTSSSTSDKFLELGYIIAMAILAILVVLIKRGLFAVFFAVN